MQTDDEAERLAALKELNLLDTPPEERFDRITRLASTTLRAPIAMVSLVDEFRQWFKSTHGIAASETPREISFCTFAIRSDELFIVEDATRDERFSANPLVVGAPFIRSYAAAPLHAGRGKRIGTLCVIDIVPRQFSSVERRSLSDLAAVIESEFARSESAKQQAKLESQNDDLKRRAEVDALTTIWNRDAILRLFSDEVARSGSGSGLGIAMIDIDRFKIVNDTHGHLVGDDVLRELAQRLRRNVRQNDHVGRYGGEEFLVVFTSCDAESAANSAERLRASIASAPFETSDGPVEITVSIGVATFDPIDPACDSLIAAADRALYEAKRAGRNQVYSDPRL